MSAQIGKHLQVINDQRQILQDWTAYEYELDRYWQTPQVSVIFDFEGIIAHYHHNLDVAEIRLKTAAKKGAVVDITETPVGHDIRCVSDPRSTRADLADKNRSRRNLIRMDFYERFGRMVDVEAFKLTIPRTLAPRPAAPMADLAVDIQMAVYEPGVLAVFGEKSDAMLYRLGLEH